jgi:V8-like Glu-specific endopeptidase
MKPYRWKPTFLVLSFLFITGSVIAQEKIVSKRNATPASAGSVYWTAERMAAARPEPLAVRYGSPLSATDGEELKPTGPAGSAAAQGPGEAKLAEPLAQVVGDPDLPLLSSYFAYPFPFVRSEVLPLSLYTSYPWSVNGKLFFTKPGIGDFVCSGTVVASGTAPRRALVLTAGHCVSSGSGTFWTNFKFVPALRDTLRPFGTWDWDWVTTTGEWHNTANNKRDFAFVVTSKRFDGVSVGNLTGNAGLAWNVADKQEVWAHGYPAQTPFTGRRMILCTAAIAGRDSFAGTGPAPMALGCDQNGGASGGSWKRGVAMNNPGYAIGVFSYKYNIQPLSTYSPYFDTAFVTLWQHAQTLVSP